MRVTIRTGPTTRQSTEALSRGLALLMLTVVVLGVLFAALFPFDFTLPRGTSAIEKIKRDFDRSPEPPVLEDKATNVLFFVPVGFCIAAVVRTKRARNVVRVVCALVGGFALSLLVELGQTFLGFRDPTWSDVWMNTVGSGIGAMGFSFVGERTIELAAQQLLKLKRFFSPRVLWSATALWAALVCFGPLMTRDRGSLHTWDSAYPLLLGNERTRERPWRGMVGQLSLAARAISQHEVQQLFATGNASLTGDAVVGDYQLTGPGPYKDRLGNLPELQWDASPPPDQSATGPARVSDIHFLRTNSAVSSANARICGTCEFTIALTCATTDLSLNGPGRICSISINTALRNVMIGQEGDHLALRVRMPGMGLNGTSPQVELPGVFTDESERHIVITYRDTVLIAYVDGQERGRIEVTPEAAITWAMYPRGMWRIVTERAGFRSYAVVYRVIAFVPLCALLLGALSVSGLSRRQKIVMVAGSILGCAVLLEVVIGMLMTSGFQTRNLMISAVISGVTIGAILLHRRGRTIQ